MVILDTDHVSLLEWDYDGSVPLREHLAQYAMRPKSRLVRKAVAK